MTHNDDDYEYHDMADAITGMPYHYVPGDDVEYTITFDQSAALLLFRALESKAAATPLVEAEREVFVKLNAFLSQWPKIVRPAPAAKVDRLMCPHGCGHQFSAVWNWDWMRAERAEVITECPQCHKPVDLKIVAERGATKEKSE